MRITTRSALLGFAVLVFALEALCPPAEAQRDRDAYIVPKTSLNAPPPEDRVDINHAGMKELLKVRGMTPSWAGRIVRFRPYHTKADLLERGIVNSQVYDRIKDYIIAHRDKQ